MNDFIEVEFVNTLSSSSARLVPIASGVTLGDFLRTQGVREDSGQVLVNREAKSNSYVLQDGDDVTVSPKNVKAA